MRRMGRRHSSPLRRTLKALDQTTERAHLMAFSEAAHSRSMFWALHSSGDCLKQAGC